MRDKEAASRCVGVGRDKVSLKKKKRNATQEWQSTIGKHLKNRTSPWGARSWSSILHSNPWILHGRQAPKKLGSENQQGLWTGKPQRRNHSLRTCMQSHSLWDSAIKHQVGKFLEHRWKRPTYWSCTICWRVRKLLRHSLESDTVGHNLCD